MPRTGHAPLVRVLRAFAADDRGGTAIEYGMLAALVFLTILAAVTLFAAETTAMWATISDHMG